MKKSVFVLIAMCIIGAVVAVTSLRDVKLVMSGKTLKLEEMEIDDFKKDAMVEGDISFLIGPVAVREQETKRYGITTGKTETNYYFATAMTVDEFIEALSENDEDDAFNDMVFFVYSVTNKEKVKEADKLCDACEDYLHDLLNGKQVMPPDKTIRIEGKLIDSPSESDYNSIMSEKMNEACLPDDIFGEMVVRDKKPGTIEIVIFIVGILLFAVSLVIIIVRLIRSLKIKKAQKLY